MIWHIFRKDWKLEWQLAIGMAIAQLFGMLLKPERVPVPLLLAALFLGRAFLIVRSVHNDPIPGVRQDWLVRPIRRSELLAAKCLFVVLMVQGPVFVGDLIGALADGFSFGASLSAALSRSVYLLIAFCFPILAISSMTKNLMEVLASVLFGLTASIALASHWNGPPSVQALQGTGLGWMVETAFLLVLVMLTAAVLTMQFRRRMTIASRWLTAAGGAVLTVIVLLPWQQSAFALQSRLSPAPGAAHSVEITEQANPAPVPWGQRGMRSWPGKVNLRIPLSVAGLPGDSILTEDHYEMHLIDSQGVIRAESQSLGGDELQVGRAGAGPVVSLNWRAPAIPAIYNTIPMEESDYVRLKDQRVRMEVDYSLTLRGLAESYAIPAVHGEARLPGFGWCSTEVNQFGNGIIMMCIQAGPRPDCYSWFLEHTPDGRRNAEEYGCNSSNYSPWFAPLFPDAISHFAIDRSIRGVPFHDPTGQAHYAVDAADIGEAKVVIRNYRPLEHFTRRVTMSERPLSDWLAK